MKRRPPRKARRLRRALGSVRRRLVVRAAALECAALLVLVLVATVGVSWTTWQHLVDSRVRLSAEQGPAPAPAPTADIVDRDAGRHSITSSPQQRPAGRTSERRAPDHRSSAPSKAVTVDGPALASGAVAVTLALGFAASLSIHRRYRGQRQQGAEAVDRSQAPQPEADPAAGVPELPVPQRTAVLTRPHQPHRPRTPEAPRDVRPTPQPAAAAATASAKSQGSGSTAPSGTPARRRRVLVDRRAHERVVFEHSAQLRWRELRREVSTVDLSEIGVRIHLDTGAAATAPPVGEWVDVVLPVGDAELSLQAEVKNRAATETGSDIGLEFKNLSEYNRQRLRAAVISIQLWGPSTA